MIRIIDSKKIDLTDSEWSYYQKLVRDYTTEKRSGEDYFSDLFITNDQGIIIFLKPPSKNYSSPECFMFLMTVMIHQHLRNACDEVDSLREQYKNKIVEAEILLNELREVRDQLKLKG